MRIDRSEISKGPRIKRAEQIIVEFDGFQNFGCHGQQILFVDDELDIPGEAGERNLATKRAYSRASGRFNGHVQVARKASMPVMSISL